MKAAAPRGGAGSAGPSLNRSLWLYALHQKSSEPGQWRCPKCDVPMRSVRLPSAVLELCPECRGLFLDNGELEKRGAGQ